MLVRVEAELALELQPRGRMTWHKNLEERSGMAFVYFKIVGGNLVGLYGRGCCCNGGSCLEWLFGLGVVEGTDGLNVGCHSCQLL